MENTKFEQLIANLEEMTSSGVFTAEVTGVEQQPVNGEFGNSVDPTNNDFYATGDARIPAGAKKVKCKCKKPCGCKKKKKS
jgi:hypothetical protein